MAGRPTASESIVPPDSVVPLQDMVESIGIIKIFSCWPFSSGETPSTPSDVIKWLARYGLLANEMSCPNCGAPMRIIKYSTSVNDGMRWKCPNDGVRRSIRHGSFFSKSNLPLKTLVQFIILYSSAHPLNYIIEQLEISTHPAVDWAHFLREIAGQWIFENQQPIGGPGTVVEIDESLFMQRKYHRGEHNPHDWYLGLIERGNKQNLILLPVFNDRSRAHLEPLIQQWVLPGTRIITDGWAAYRQLGNLPEGYTHDVVNHSIEFVNPIDRSINTQAIEGLWAHAKKPFKAMNGTSKSLFDSHLEWFQFKRVHPTLFFANLMFWIRFYYSNNDEAVNADVAVE